MRKLWPLGKGSHTRSLVHTIVAAGAAFLVLLLAAIVAMGGPGDPTVAAGVRLWGSVIFVVLALQAATLVVFRPSFLRLLLPTPRQGRGLFDQLDPLGTWAYGVLPYAFGVLVGMPALVRGAARGLATILYACALFRLLAPVIVKAALELRKILVPWGHVAVWLAGLAAIGGLITEVPRHAEWAVNVPFLLSAGSPAVPFVTALVLFLLAIPVGRIAASASARLLRRDELLDRAFPLSRRKASARRSMLVELVPGGRRSRRLALVVQESLGLHRGVDWMKAALVWLAAFAGSLYLLAGVGGSIAHMALTLVAMSAVLLWTGLRRLRIREGRLTAGLPGHALPLGALEVLFGQIAVVSAVYFGTGLVAALGLWLLGVPPVDAGSLFRRAWAFEGVALPSLVNLVQCWLLILGLWAGAAVVALTRARPGEGLSIATLWRFLRVGVCVGSLWGILMVAALGALPMLVAGSLWAPILPQGTKAVMLYVFADRLGDAAAFAESLERAMEAPAEFWPFGFLAWVVPASVAVYFIVTAAVVGRGRAHPSYRMPMPKQTASAPGDSVLVRAGG